MIFLKIIVEILPNTQNILLDSEALKNLYLFPKFIIYLQTGGKNSEAQKHI